MFAREPFVVAEVIYDHGAGTQLQSAKFEDANGARKWAQDALRSDKRIYEIRLDGQPVSVSRFILDGPENMEIFSAKANPFFVSPKGAAVEVSAEDFEGRNFPRRLEREGTIEVFDPADLPPGFSLRKSGSQFHILFEGRDTGLYALDARKAAEIAHRKRGSFTPGKKVTRAKTAELPDGGPRDNALFKIGRAELVLRSRQGDQAAAQELLRRGRDLQTGLKTSGLGSRIGKAVSNPADA